MYQALPVEINEGALICAHKDYRYNHPGMIRTANLNQDGGEIQTKQNDLEPEHGLVHQISSMQIRHDDHGKAILH